ncbi:glycosyltransferase [Bacillus phage vB_BceH_LY2]|nr:glycosyltransferase [Bacillus phage vB_BceH_LY2]
MTKKQTVKTEELNKGLTDEELATYVNFLFSGEITDKKHEEAIKKIHNKKATIGDATVIANYSVKKVEKIVTQLISTVTIQGALLRELGVTPEQYEKAKEEYDEGIEARVKELQEQLAEGKAETK